MSTSNRLYGAFVSLPTVNDRLTTICYNHETETAAAADDALDHVREVHAATRTRLAIAHAARRHRPIAVREATTGTEADPSPTTAFAKTI